MSPRSQTNAYRNLETLSEHNKSLSVHIAELSAANARLVEERDKIKSMLKASQQDLQSSNARSMEKTGTIKKLLKRFNSAMNLVKEKDDTIKLQDDLIKTQRDLIRSLERSEGSTGR